MPETDVIFYREDDGTVPLIEWLDSLAVEARDRCQTKLKLLEELGHELRRPQSKNLGGGLHELRIKFFHINYRILYFFHGRAAAVISHGFSKERKVPPRELKLAKARIEKFNANPELHTFRPHEE